MSPPGHLWRDRRGAHAPGASLSGFGRGLRRWVAVAIVLPQLMIVPTHAAPISVRDDAGQVITLPAPARRVVALSPHLAEMAFAAGGGNRLVGVMRYSDFPPEVTRLPLIGDAFAINLEAVVALKPDLLLVWNSGLQPRQQQRLKTLGIPIYTNETTTVDGIVDSLRRLGRLFGTETVAEAAALRAEQDWATLRARHARRAPVRVFYQLWHEPLMTVNQGHLIDQAIRACGGVNTFANAPGLTPTVSWEAAVASDPQVVITSAATDEPAFLEPWSRFPRVEAVRHRRLKVIDGHKLARMTPRFIEAAADLCAAIDVAR